ncbi:MULTISPECIES: tyrosine-type recombinase/integrase [unclassified Rickettsia]|uniref:tyrosine-type recombinase/integrase n=1 Tax=unclassified Rickettsia TaxID=114295 RepID=UPI003132EF1C
MSELINFTKERLTKIAIPATGIRVYRDSKERGLILIASYGGSKVFYLYKTIDGKPERIKLGEFPYITIDEARIKAIELKTQVARGINPVKEKKAQKAALQGTLSLRELFNRYIDDYAKHNVVTWERLVLQMNRQAKTLYDRKLLDITTEDIQSVFNDLTVRISKVTANRFLTLINAVLNKGVKWRLLEKNPAISVERHRANKPRIRYITKEEMPKFFKAVEEGKNRIMADFFLMALFTGCRRGNVAAMRWDNISFAGSVWQIERTKNGKPQEIHLSPAVVEILRRRRQENANDPNINDNGFVFPSKKSKSGHIESSQYAWSKLCNAAGLKKIIVHDLRRTYGTWMRLAANADREVIGIVLGHEALKTTEIYDIIESVAVKKFRDVTTNAMAVFSGTKPQDNDLFRQLRQSISDSSNTISKILSESSFNHLINNDSLAGLIKMREMSETVVHSLNTYAYGNVAA